MHARYYSPNLGRFLSVDPVGGNVESSQSWNRYSYVWNNPVNATDPDGKWLETAFDIGMAAISIRQAVKDPSLGNIAGAALDVGAVLLPVVPAVGGRAIDAAQATTKAADKLVAVSDANLKRVVVSSKRHPESAAHIVDAQKAGQPSKLTIDRPGAPGRRSESLAGKNKVPGKDLDEYPPAMFEEGGAGASVRPVDPVDNRGAGACIGNQCRNLPNGAKVEIVVE